MIQGQELGAYVLTISSRVYAPCVGPQAQNRNNIWDYFPTSSTKAQFQGLNHKRWFSWSTIVLGK